MINPRPQLLPQDVENLIGDLLFNDDGLIPAIAQQHDTGEVLMMAWMNEQAIRQTLVTGRVCYWSRSRQALWRKGETSGQVQNLIDFRWDCDGDTILIQVDQTGVACHTGRRHCFYNALREDGPVILAKVETDPSVLYGSSDTKE